MVFFFACKFISISFISFHDVQNCSWMSCMSHNRNHKKDDHDVHNYGLNLQSHVQHLCSVPNGLAHHQLQDCWHLVQHVLQLGQTTIWKPTKHQQTTHACYQNNWFLDHQHYWCPWPKGITLNTRSTRLKEKIKPHQWSNIITTCTQSHVYSQIIFTLGRTLTYYASSNNIMQN